MLLDADTGALPRLKLLHECYSCTDAKAMDMQRCVTHYTVVAQMRLPGT